MINIQSARSPAIRLWLITCMAMVVTMVFVGGVTRLTESGLSIVEWKLVSGILPPLTQEAWEAELAAYRATPEYQQINRGMSVDEFKRIFWLEWLHRLLGRITGFVFALPFLYFWMRGCMDNALTRRMAAISLLVGAQGAVGWLMVASGLVDQPRVSPIRLSLHLSLAFLVFCLTYLTFMQMRGKTAFSNLSGWMPLAARALLILVVVQIIFGAWVAGLDAGMIYNTWPLMDGSWAPPILAPLSPFWLNLVEHVPTVQWQHRMGAYVVSTAVLAVVIGGWRHAASRGALMHLGGVLFVQFTLGVLTLIHEVPLVLASAHQLVALALLAACVKLCILWQKSGVQLPLASKAGIVTLNRS